MKRKDETAEEFVAVAGFCACAEVWRELAAALEPGVRFHAVDLPGHGGRECPAAWTLDDITRQIAQEFSHPAVWLGWSLGALAAIRAAALFPHIVTAVIALAMGPRFIRASGWPNALAPSALEQFRADLDSDPEATINRFYALQTRAGGRPRPVLARRLKALAAARGLPERASLMGALEVLTESDLRRDCQALRCPALFILGADDALVPAGVADDIPTLNPSLRVEVVAGAGHAPFLSHPESVTRQIKRFLETLGAEREREPT